jgi:nitrogen fixation/metabolism regulation signal transduction histidine kinase
MSSPQNSHQKSAVLVFGIALLIVFVALGSEAAFNLHFLHPRGSTQIVLFAGLSLVVFLLLVALLFLLFRNILKLYADQRSNALGSRLRARLMLGALLLSFAPVVAMFLFSYILMNRSIDRWFSQPVTTLREDADNMAEQLQHYAMENARAAGRHGHCLPRPQGDAARRVRSVVQERVATGHVPTPADGRPDNLARRWPGTACIRRKRCRSIHRA